MIASSLQKQTFKPLYSVNGGSVPSITGLGRATAEELAARGGQVVLACRNVEQAKEVADYLTGTYKRSHVIALQVPRSTLIYEQMQSHNLYAI